MYKWDYYVNPVIPCDLHSSGVGVPTIQSRVNKNGRWDDDTHASLFYILYKKQLHKTCLPVIHTIQFIQWVNGCYVVGGKKMLLKSMRD